MICDGMAFIIIVQNDDGNDAMRHGFLVTPRRYVINEDLGHHFSSIFSNSLLTPPLDQRHSVVLSKVQIGGPLFRLVSLTSRRIC